MVGELDELRRWSPPMSAERCHTVGTHSLPIEGGLPIPDDRLKTQPAAERSADEERRRRA